MSFVMKFNRTRPASERYQRLHRMQERARLGAVLAAEQLGPAALRARQVAEEQMLGARRLTAPQLKRAAEYVEEEFAPRLSGILSAAAQRIEPPRLPSHRMRNVVLGVLAVAGVIGIAGAVLTRWKVNATYIREVDEMQTAPQGSARSSSPSSPSSSGPLSGLPSSQQGEQRRSARRAADMGERQPRTPHP